jgi:hypothetical protein
MKHRRSKRRHLIVAVCGTAAVARCDTSREYLPTGTGHVVQVVSVAAAPNPVKCGSAPRFIPVLFNVVMVNTTSSAVTLSKVGSAGIKVDGATLGPIALQFDSLPFTPILLRANDGQATTQVSMQTPCAVLGRIQLWLYMFTTAGQYATTPMYLTVVPGQ